MQEIAGVAMSMCNRCVMGAVQNNFPEKDVVRQRSPGDDHGKRMKTTTGRFGVADTEKRLQLTP